MPTTRRAVASSAYTSGTTGRPRGAILTAAALRANQEQCLAMTPPPVRADDRVLLVLPLFHVYGLNAGFGLVAATGACAVLQETFDPRGSLALMAEEQVTAVPGAPPMYQAWLAAADAAGSDAELRRGFAAMRMASSGAAPLPEEVWTAMRDRAAVTVWEGYGLTEAVAGGGQHAGHRAGQARTASAARCPASSSSCGTPPTDASPAERRPTRRRPPRGARARSGCAAPTCSPATGPTAPTGPDDDGWLGTGDLAYRDADGDLHLVDRRSDLILVSGFNVYPAEVERVLDAHPAVAESAVIGVPDPRTGSAVRAVVVLAPGQDVDLRGAAGARRRVAGPVQGADVGALPAVAAALADRQGQPGPAARARPAPGRRRRSGGGRRWLTARARLQLLTRAGCHLCETAAETLTRIGAEAGLVPEAVDVDADPELQAEYGDRVPVVLLDGREHSYFTVDVVRLRRDLGLAEPAPSGAPSGR